MQDFFRRQYDIHVYIPLFQPYGWMNLTLQQPLISRSNNNFGFTSHDTTMSQPNICAWICMYIHYIYIQPSNVISYKYIYIYIIIYIIDIWVFPKIMAPPNHPFVHRVFHYVHHLFWGFSPYFWFNTHIHRYPQIMLFMGPRLDVDDMTNSRLNDITHFYLVVFHQPIWFNICCLVKLDPFPQGSGWT